VSCGLFAGCLCWMLQAWTTRQWALAITILEILTLGTSTYWAQSYWGGMVASVCDPKRSDPGCRDNRDRMEEDDRNSRPQHPLAYCGW
jgi:hypothetical protein